jgi:hypothetical protein
MADPDTVAIPVLAGAALTQGVTFLYGQAAEALRIRRVDRAAHRTALNIPEVFESADCAALPDLVVLGARARELQMLLSIAEPFMTRRPADLDGADEALRTCFGHIREALEEIYRVNFTFLGERRSGPRVQQTVTDVRGPTTGMRIRGPATRAAGEVIQRVKTVHQSGELTGIDIDSRG